MSKGFEIGQHRVTTVEQGLLLGSGHLVPRTVDHADARVALEKVPVSGVKMPVEAVERARVVLGFALTPVRAGRTMRPHFVHVVGRRDVRLTAHDASVGELAHAARVGDLNPFKGVDVHAQIPRVHLVRIDAGQQGEIARHHQTLDMVRVSVVEGLGDGVLQAPHARLSGPKPRRQFPVVLEKIQGRVLRHLRPVDATHVFAPSENLANEAFDLFDARMLRSRAPLAFHHLNDLARAEDLDVHREAEAAVVNSPAVFRQGILEIPKPRKKLLDEQIQEL